MVTLKRLIEKAILRRKQYRYSPLKIILDSNDIGSHRILKAENYFGNEFLKFDLTANRILAYKGYLPTVRDILNRVEELIGSRFRYTVGPFGLNKDVLKKASTGGTYRSQYFEDSELAVLTDGSTLRVWYAQIFADAGEYKVFSTGSGRKFVFKTMSRVMYPLITYDGKEYSLYKHITTSYVTKVKAEYIKSKKEANMVITAGML